MSPSTEYIIRRMMQVDSKLYEKILDTPIFAFCFNELVKKRH